MDGRKCQVLDQVQSRSKRLHTASRTVLRMIWLALKQQLSRFTPSSKASKSKLSADFSGSFCDMSVCLGGELLSSKRVPKLAVALLCLNGTGVRARGVLTHQADVEGCSLACQGTTM